MLGTYHRGTPCQSSFSVSKSNPVKNNIQKFCHHIGCIKRVIIYYVYVLLYWNEHPLSRRNSRNGSPECLPLTPCSRCLLDWLGCYPFSLVCGGSWRKLSSRLIPT